MEVERGGAIWLASFPKSGNTWLRCLLEAYRRNGVLDINDIRFSHSDGGGTLMQGVSPMPLQHLDFNSQMLLRPAAIFNQLCRLTKPIYVKTHSANIQPDGLPPCIPEQWTERAVYVMRDPRSVVLSMSRFFKFSLQMAVETMRRIDFRLGDNATFATVFVSSWSNHVRSWAGESRFPVHVVRYEDMARDAVKELTEVLEFLGEDVDPDRVQTAVEATRLEKLREAEKQSGFREHSGQEGGAFFGDGGVRWQDELGSRWVEAIENDHGDVMQLMGYLNGDQQTSPSEDGIGHGPASARLLGDGRCNGSGKSERG